MIFAHSMLSLFRGLCRLAETNLGVRAGSAAECGWGPTLPAFLLSCFLLFGGSAWGQPAGRSNPENELLAKTGLHLTVGHQEADIVGRDNRAIQAAVDTVAQQGGGTVSIGPGEYLMRDSLHLRSGVTVRGAGPETVLKKGPEIRSWLTADGDFGEYGITVANPDGFEPGDGVHVATQKVHGFHTICATVLNKKDRYLTLSRPLNADCMVADEAWAATLFPVISAYHIANFRLENLTVEGNRENNGVIDGCRGAGIFFYQGDAGVIENCTVRGYAGDGISFQQSNDVQVLNCVVETCAGGGIHPGSGSQRAIVRGCKALKNDRDGFFFCWRVRHAVVEHNEFRGNGATGVSIGHKDSDNLIRHNLVEENRGGGVLWRNETEPMAAHRILFENNTLRDNGPWGLFVDGVTQGTVLRGNIIAETGSGRQKTGIRIGKQAGLVLMENNTIQAATPVNDERSSVEKIAPTLANVSYGPHERNVLDFYKAESTSPTPLLFFIHGGGWVRGDKAGVAEAERYLAAGISMVAINYRFVWQAQLAGAAPPVSWPLADAARALQFVRSKAGEWNIDKQRIGASGGSAGACSSLYLALHDDLADPKSADPVARESTRLWCAAVTGAQTSLDPKQLTGWTPNSRYGGHAFGFMNPRALDGRDNHFPEFLASREQVLPWIKAYSPYEHVSKGDPPLYLIYKTPPTMGQTQEDPTHSANYGVPFQERCRKAGVRCELVYPGAPDVRHPGMAEFLINTLKQ